MCIDFSVDVCLYIAMESRMVCSVGWKEVFEEVERITVCVLCSMY